MVLCRKGGTSNMEKISHGVVKHRKILLIICVLLLIPSVIGIKSTRINYDLLTYLPGELDTVKGQDILLDDYNQGAYTIIVMENMDNDEIREKKQAIQKIDHVGDVIWYDELFSSAVPMEILPDKIYDSFNTETSSLMVVFFDTSVSADETIEAVGNIRQAMGEDAYITGMSALVKDLKDLCEREEPFYVGIAVLCATVFMMALLNSWVLPFIFLMGIGFAVMYNMGTNVFMGEISYITKALASVLQLAVTMDYSIFLWHSFEEERERLRDSNQAMEKAIVHTFTTVAGSSVTTIAGFVALCFMSFTVGRDLGIVMAKGVVLGVISCVTILPALILTFEKLIDKTAHKPIVPKLEKTAKFVLKHSTVFLIIFLVALGPAYYAYSHAGVYYDMAGVLPKDMNFVISNEKLIDQYNISNMHMIMVDKDMTDRDLHSLTEEIKKTDGIEGVLSLDTVAGEKIPDEILPSKIRKVFKQGGHQLILMTSEYTTSSDEVNNQIEKLEDITKKYDKEGMVIGEAACTKDMMKVTDRDFKIVSAISFLFIFVILAVVLKSGSLPIILMLTIYLAIFINLGIPFITGTELPFIAPICLSTIQLGATVDYAILLTTRYKRERTGGMNKNEAVYTALATSSPSIVVSALVFFAATIGVSIYSEMDIICSMCGLMARGAIISMIAVIFILPAFLKAFDKLIVKTTKDMRSIRKELKGEGAE